MNVLKAAAEERDANGTLVLADDVLLRKWAERLRSGESGNSAHGIAKRMIEDFCVRAWLRKPQSHYTLCWLAEVLSEILDSGKPDARRSFSLLPRAEGGRKAVGEAIDIACWVELTKQRGYTGSDARELAASIFHKDVAHIRRQHKRALANALEINQSADWQALFVAKHRPLPPPRKPRQSRASRTRTR